MNLIYKSSLPKPADSYAVTIGVFDGLHLGHKYLLKKLKSEADKRGKPSLVITFDFPPEKVISPGRHIGYLTDYKQKASLINSLGIENLWVLETKKDLLSLKGSEFLSYINSRFPICLMFVGSDFRFGAKAKDDIQKLKKLSQAYQFDLRVIQKKKFKGVLVSSSFLRKLIREGRLAEAKKFLGRDYAVKGKVKKGKGLGRRLGFPTANLDTFGYLLPRQGVYSAWTKVRDKIFLSAVNIGKKEFESHLINFSRNILNETIEVFLLERIRDELNFKSQAKLAEHIQKDIQTITAKYSIPAK